mmetsp:Transcript_131810/g.381221  ORF Transcript_131810/g.381221 Transcript_131810/m.381221 type:complete len:162 (-) Transcript_131810:157-642(-)
MGVARRWAIFWFTAHCFLPVTAERTAHHLAGESSSASSRALSANNITGMARRHSFAPPSAATPSPPSERWEMLWDNMHAIEKQLCKISHWKAARAVKFARTWMAKRACVQQDGTIQVVGTTGGPLTVTPEPRAPSHRRGMCVDCDPQQGVGPREGAKDERA